MKLKNLLAESTFLKKGGYDTVSFYSVRNAVEKFIRKTYKGDGGRAMGTLDDVAKSIEKSINDSVYSLEQLEKKYDNSMEKWVSANEDRIRDLVYRNL